MPPLLYVEAKANSSQESLSDAEMSVTVVAAEWPDFAAHSSGQITLRLASGSRPYLLRSPCAPVVPRRSGR